MLDETIGQFLHDMIGIPFFVPHNKEIKLPESNPSTNVEFPHSTCCGYNANIPLYGISVSFEDDEGETSNDDAVTILTLDGDYWLDLARKEEFNQYGEELTHSPALERFNVVSSSPFSVTAPVTSEIATWWYDDEVKLKIPAPNSIVGKMGENSWPGSYTHLRKAPFTLDLPPNAYFSFYRIHTPRLLTGYTPWCSYTSRPKANAGSLWTYLINIQSKQWKIKETSSKASMLDSIAGYRYEVTHAMHEEVQWNNSNGCHICKAQAPVLLKAEDGALHVLSVMGES